MVSQFKSADKVRLLGELNYDFPPGIHAIGRLDSHSEGLLILTTNKRVTKLLFQGEVPHKRTYLVRVNGCVEQESLNQLRSGVHIRVEDGLDYLTPPCEVNIVEPPSFLLPYQLQAAHIPHTWLTLDLYEGKFHQVRKMVSAIHHQCRRLIRLSIEDLQLGNLPPGGVLEIPEEEFFNLLHIRNWRETSVV